MTLFGCRRFARILNEVADREATPSEEEFLHGHRSACERCRREERAAESSLNLLRSATLTAEVEDSFDRRVLRRARVQKVQEGFQYWRPALLGGLAAAGLLLAAVQSLTKPIAPGATPRIQASRHLKPSLALDDARFVEPRVGR